MSEIFDILQSSGAEPYFNGSAISCKAIYRGGTSPGSIAIYEKDNKVIDFVAGKSWTIPEFIKQISGKDIEFAAISAPPLDVIDCKRFIDDSYLQKLKPHYNYWKDRGISPELLKKLRNGVSESGKLWQRSVFPIFDIQGRIEGLAGRDITGKSDKKWKLLGPKNTWMWPIYFNRKVIAETKTICILESIGDWLTLGTHGIYNGLVIFGLELGNGAFSALLQLDPDRILISTNNDVNGRGNAAARKIRNRLLKYFDSEQLIIALPESVGDFGEQSKENLDIWKKKYNL